MKAEQFKSITDHISRLHQTARQSVVIIGADVDALIANQEQGSNLIEHMLDTLLDLAFLPEGLAEFKKLCRYYLTLNPLATRDYVYAYREMWDDEYEC